MYFVFITHRNEFSYILCISLISLLLLCANHTVQSSSSSLTASFPVSQEEEEICGDIDIRNNVSNFEKLINCTVIEGFLQIVLIDRSESEAYTNLSFPKLREITGYLFLYRVANLTTLANIFPNLSVIRGAKLFRNYALVIYQMLYLQEIGLPSLTTIVRGSVHISSNRQLCYVDTIDWDAIATSGKGGHFIKGNKENNQCPNDCPHNQQCPTKLINHRTVKLCWNRFHCQKVCHCANGACNDNGECCHEECLGGCNGQGPGNCSACKRVFWKGMCLSKCPGPTNQFANRRCVTNNECLTMTRKTSANEVYWKLFNQTCIEECPDGYIADEYNKTVCRKCNGTCPIECPGIVVDSIAEAQLLKQQGCTRIAGSLEIQISGGTNIVRELEENLMMIKEVDDYVKIVRSHPLVSLNFLKNLQKIHGKRRNNKDYSLWVFDNQNLQELIDINKTLSKLEIVSGKVFFHYNPKLCKNKIEEFLRHSNFTNWDDHDVSTLTNGDRAACTLHPLKVKILARDSTVVRIRWQNFQTNMSDHRTLLSYVVSYKEAPFKNVSIYEGRDACGADTWKIDDVEPSGNDGVYEDTVLSQLNPATQYAVYVKTYTTAKEQHGAQSEIIYFKTLADTPSSPVDVKIVSLKSSSLEISWQPPTQPNGIITHYIIKGSYQKYDQEYLFRRNYCESPLEIPERSTKTDFTEKITPVGNKTMMWDGYFPSRKCCECPKENSKLKNADAEFSIDFEDSIHNHVYIKRGNRSPPDTKLTRKKRSIATNSQNNISNAVLTSTTTSNFDIGMESNDTAQPDDYLAFHVVVNMSTSTVIKSLRHFSEYMIEIVACQDPPENGTTNKAYCSKSTAIATARTAPLFGADNINSLSVSVKLLNSTSDHVNVTWDQPLSPNGLIVTYQIEYRHLNIQKFKPTPICITQKEYEKNKGYVLRNLSPGNYSLRIRATSLAGDGNWTYATEFIVQESAAYLTPTSPGGVSTNTVIISAIGSLVLLFFGFGITFYLYKKRLQKIPNDILYASVNPEYMTTIYKADEWELPREKITLMRTLGQGSFGMVYEGIAKNIRDGENETTCAVKTINEHASLGERIEFLNEAQVMKQFSCQHVVKLLGVVSKGQPTLVVMELMACGDLKSYLRSHRPDIVDNNGQQPPTLKQILQMASEIADGMAYLAAIKFVHRDLAARNCMVAGDLTVKIGDFGMTRDVYETDYYRKGGKGLLPIRWMAPESLKDGVFTSQSDVWSYGIVLWEMATLASQPYLGLSNEQVLKYVMDGGIMTKPENCPKRLYDTMNICWNHNPKMRPTFMELVHTLIGDVGSKFHEVSFYSTQVADSTSFEMPDGEEPSPSTPLKRTVNNIHNDLHAGKQESDDSDNESIDAKSLSSNRDYCSTKDVGSNHAETIHSNESSKGSKISDYSVNGGLANGHVNLPYSSHAEC